MGHALRSGKTTHLVLFVVGVHEGALAVHLALLHRAGVQHGSLRPVPTGWQEGSPHKRSTKAESYAVPPSKKRGVTVTDTRAGTVSYDTVDSYLLLPHIKWYVV